MQSTNGGYGPSSSLAGPAAGVVPFDQMTAQAKLRCFGVDYIRVRTSDGGDLYLTRHGWPFQQHLMPERWFFNQRYYHHGERLPGSTGSVYRVGTEPINGRAIDLVVKFSRVGQEVPLEIATSFPEAISPVELANARFNSPFEEFGLVMEMRRETPGPQTARVLAQRPLAIFVPPEEHELWQLGRTPSRFLEHQLLLERDQEGTPERSIELDIRRGYVLLYSWVKGHNAEDLYSGGQLDDAGFSALAPRVSAELRQRGFRVLDNKPKHFILRPRRRGAGLLRRPGGLVYALVDFELLERTIEYRQQYREAQRAKYWRLLWHSHVGQAAPVAALPPGLAATTVFGVSYVYGTPPNGGRLWVVGRDPDLYDYFLPDRWRRTPRVKLSWVSELYHTRSKDNVHLVYRKSRVGDKPHVDPFYDQGRRIRELGFSSPFEEVAIAEHLRRQGVATVYPRAVYRTGHESMRANYVIDQRRFQTHAGLLTPGVDAEPILSPRHDYYVIWGLWRGVDPIRDYRDTGRWGTVDCERAVEEETITRREHDEILETTRARLAARGYNDETIGGYQLMLSFDADGRTLQRDEAGRFEVTLCLDALRCFDHHLLNEEEYRGLIEDVRQRVLAAGCEPINLSGNHLLMSLNPDGVLHRDARGRYEATLCNFELIRPHFLRAT